MTRLEKGIIYPWWLQHKDYDSVELYAKLKNKFVSDITMLESVKIN